MAGSIRRYLSIIAAIAIGSGRDPEPHHRGQRPGAPPRHCLRRRSPARAG